MFIQSIFVINIARKRWIKFVCDARLNMLTNSHKYTVHTFRVISLLVSGISFVLFSSILFFFRSLLSLKWAKSTTKCIVRAKQTFRSVWIELSNVSPFALVVFVYFLNSQSCVNVLLPFSIVCMRYFSNYTRIYTANIEYSSHSEDTNQSQSRIECKFENIQNRLRYKLLKQQTFRFRFYRCFNILDTYEQWA